MSTILRFVLKDVMAPMFGYKGKGGHYNVISQEILFTYRLILLY